MTTELDDAICQGRLPDWVGTRVQLADDKLIPASLLPHTLSSMAQIFATDKGAAVVFETVDSVLDMMPPVPDGFVIVQLSLLDGKETLRISEGHGRTLHDMPLPFADIGELTFYGRYSPDAHNWHYLLRSEL